MGGLRRGEEVKSLGEEGRSQEEHGGMDLELEIRVGEDMILILGVRVLEVVGSL